MSATPLINRISPLAILALAFLGYAVPVRGVEHCPWDLPAAECPCPTPAEFASACPGDPDPLVDQMSPVGFDCDYYYCEGIGSNPQITTRRSWWIYDIFFKRMRFEISYTAAAGYHIQFPAIVEFAWDQEQVYPGNTFEVAVTFATFNSSEVDHEYRATLPGAEPGIHVQQLVCTWTGRCHWETILNWTEDYLFDSLHDFDDEHPPDLGEERNDFNGDVAFPIPEIPGLPDWTDLLDLVLSIKLRLKHEMQDRNIQGTAGVLPSAADGGDAVTDTTADLYVWDENYETLYIPITLPAEYCDDKVTLQLGTIFEYWNRAYFLPAFIFFPGTRIEFEFEGSFDVRNIFWLIDLLDDDFGFWSNTLIEDSTDYDAADHQFVVRIPVEQCPDLCAKSLTIHYETKTIDLGCLGKWNLPIWFPVLRAEIKNCSCVKVDQSFHVKFVGANHGAHIDEVLYEADVTPLQPDATIYVDSGPIFFWDRRFRVTVDSKNAIDERSEENNIAEVELAPPATGSNEVQLYDGDDQPVIIGLPETMVAGDMGVLTPIPAVALTGNCNDHTIGRFPVRDGDPNDGENDTDLKIDFSYIYEGLGLTVQYPSGGTFYENDPGILNISFSGSGFTFFKYDVIGQDENGSTLLSTETVELNIDNVPPSGLTINGPLPTTVSDFNLDVTGSALDEDEIMCIVHSRDGSKTFEYGPYTMTSDFFSFENVSLLPGDNEIEVIAFDLAGNRQTWSQVVAMDLRYDPSDVTPPEISIVSPDFNSDNSTTPCGVYIREPSPKIIAQISDVDVTGGQLGVGVDPATITVTVDGNVFDSSNGVVFSHSGLMTFTVPSALAEGQHSVTIEASDRNGNTAFKTTYFCVDTIAPMIMVVQGGCTPTASSITYTLSTEEAIVTVSLYAGANLSPDQVESSDYRETVHRDFILYTDPQPSERPLPRGEQQYSTVAAHCIAYEAKVTRPGCDNPPCVPCVPCDPCDPEDCTPDSSGGVDEFELDDGTYTIIAEAVDRAGNVGSAQNSYFVMRDPSQINQVISSSHSTFCVNMNSECTNTASASGCGTAQARITFRDGNSQIVSNRMVAIRPESFQNNYPTTIHDVFFSGALYTAAMSQGNGKEGIYVVPTNADGEVIFSVQGLTTTDGEISVIYLRPGTGTMGTPITGAATVTWSSYCADSISSGNSIVSVVGEAKVCRNYFIEVELRDSGNALLDNTTVSLWVESDRNQGGNRVDFFFDPDGPQDDPHRTSDRTEPRQGTHSGFFDRTWSRSREHGCDVHRLVSSRRNQYHTKNRGPG